MAEERNLDWGKVKEFAGLMTNDLGAALQGALSYIGDRLGIFKTLAAAGPITSADLAAKAGLDERYLREWLGAMTAAKSSRPGDGVRSGNIRPSATKLPSWTGSP